MLNEHIEEKRPGDAGAIVAKDLRALRKLPDSVALAARRRIEARIAFLRGRRERAVSLLRTHVAACERVGTRDEHCRGLFALGRALGDAEGAAMAEQALQQLAELGIVNPLSDLRAAYPELL